MKLVAINKENVDTLKEGSVFVESKKVKMILKINEKPLQKVYMVSKGVPLSLFPETKKEFIGALKKHPELKSIHFLYDKQDFVFGPTFKITF